MSNQPQGPRIIVWDIETLPILKEAMKVWPGLGAYPGLTLKATVSSIICVGWKVLGEDQTHCINAWDYPETWNEDKNDDFYVVKAAYDVLKDADCVVTHNGKRFDWKHFQTRLLVNDLPTLHKIPHVDTCAVAKRNLIPFNNRLNTLGEYLVGEKKMDHEGWDLWVKVSERDPEAMINMELYCKQDVNLLEKIFFKLRPLMTELPNHNHWTDPILGKACSHCGSYNTQRAGTRVQKNTSFQRYKCTDCGSWSQHQLKPLFQKPLRSL